MSNHTPGPWRLKSLNVMGEWEILTDNEWSIATTAGCCGANNLEDESESDANARLIAAAPALYEAAKKVLAKLDSPTLSVTVLDADDLRAALELAEKGEQG